MALEGCGSCLKYLMIVWNFIVMVRSRFYYEKYEKINTFMFTNLCFFLLHLHEIEEGFYFHFSLIVYVECVCHCL